MAKLVFGMNQSLDGYVDHDRMETGPVLFRHWTEQVAGLAGSVYGRNVYELMRYWDEDHAEWTPAHHAFAAAWRRQPKWVVSRSLSSVGPNATPCRRRRGGDGAGPEGPARWRDRGVGTDARTGADRSRPDRRVSALPSSVRAGPRHAASFAGPRPPLRLTASEEMGEDVIRLTYVPA